VTPPELHHCPVCGFDRLPCPPYHSESESTGAPSFSLCPSCGTEFGFDDDPDACGIPVEPLRRLEARETLIEVLLEARTLVARPGNNFDYSTWDDAAEAIAELTGLITAVQHGELSDLSVFFAPTGPLQEVSLGSGWSKEFLELASRFDAAYEACGGK
jgi:hypothetical protein